MCEEDVLETLKSLGYGDADARALADHFLDAERRGKRGHGLSRMMVPGAIRPKRHANSDFACALDHRPRHHAIEPNDCRHESQDAERSRSV